MKRWQRWYVGVLAVGVAVAGFVTAQRAAALGETSHEVALALSLPAARESAATQAYPLEQMLDTYQQAGVSTLMIGGTTIKSLMETGGTGFPPDYPVLVNLVDEGDASVIYVRENPALEAWLRERLQAHLGSFFVTHEPGRFVIREIDRQTVLTFNLGAHPHDIALAQQYGWRLAVNYSEPLPTPGPHWPEVRMDHLFDGLPDETPVLFTGPGWARRPEAFLRAMNLRQYTLLLDHARPPFGEELAPVAVDLAESLPTDKLFRATFATTVEDARIAVKERHYGMVLIQPYHMTGDLDADLREQAQRWSNLISALQRDGYSMGGVQPLPRYDPNLLLVMIVAAAIAAGAVALLPAWKLNHLIAAAGMLGAAALAYAVDLRGVQLLALAVAVVMPALGGLFALEAKRTWQGFAWLAGFGLAGGLMVTALLGQHPFLLELSLFRGVKATLIGPSLVFAGALLLNRWHEVRSWRLGPVPIWQVLAGGLLAVGLWIMLVRSGQEGNVALVPAWELRLRDALEQIFVARPRFKEFLVGWPMLVLALAWRRRGAGPIPYVLLAVGLMAPAGIINSFSHLHTPVWLSLLRSVHGIWLGLFLGGLAWWLLNRLKGVVRRA